MIVSERKTGGRERRVLIGMVVDKAVLGEVAAKWTKEGLFGSTWANILGDWCVDYWERYARPPGKDVEGLFQAWAEQSKDKDTVSLMEKFLSELSGEYVRLRKEMNSQQVLDLARDHFNHVRYKKLAEQVQGAIDTGRVDQADQFLNKFQKVEIGQGHWIDVLNDRNALARMFKRAAEPALIELPGDLGRFFGKSLARDNFVSFMGPEKRGKTWWLMHLAWLGLLQRQRVAFFEIGDLSEEQIMERFATRACGRPLDSEEGWPVTVRWPTAIERDGPQAAVTVEDKVFNKAPTEEEVWQAQQKFLRDRVKSKESLLRLSVHPNSTLSVAAMRSMLLTEAQKGWPVDAVFVDYADILAPPPGFQGDSREATNENWKQLRRLSQELHCLVVTATQTKATSYVADQLNMTHFAEDKRKFAHVTAMVGINQNDKEKETEVQRLNFVVRREKKFVSTRAVWVAGCLTLGNPAVRSTL